MRWTATLVILVGVAVHLLGAQRRSQREPVPQFSLVADGLHRLTQWWQPIPGLPIVPVSVFLVQQGSRWALVDAGLAGNQWQPHAQQLLAALQATVPASETLDAIILTHAHADHVGALPQLLDAYPDVKVLAHELEGPYLQGQQHYATPGGVVACLARWAGILPQAPLEVPVERLRLLEEPISDFEEVGLDDLIYVVTIGHSPGHISLLHAPSRTVLAGDAVAFLRPSLRFSREARDANNSRVIATFNPLASKPGLSLYAAQPHTLCLLPSCDAKKAAVSFCWLAEGMEYNSLIASHDWGARGSGSSTQEWMREVAAGMPECKLAVQPGDSPALDDDAGVEYQVEGDGEEDDEYE